MSAGRGSGDRHVLIVGCGYTGAVLAQRLCFGGQPVVGTTRSETQASVIRTRGAAALLLDASDLSPLARYRGRLKAVVHSIPPTMARDGSYADVTQPLLEMMADEPGLEAFVYISSTSVYGDQGGAVVTETTPCAPDSPRGEARLAIERQVLSSGLPAMVVRPAGIYGPGRSQLHRIAGRRYRLVGEGQALTNRIHVRDLATLLAAAIEVGEPGKTYLASDEEPATQQAVVDHIRASYPLPEPSRMPLAEARIRMSKDVLKMVTGSKRLDASWTLEALGVRLRYPNYRKGLAAVWQQDSAALRALAVETG